MTHPGTKKALALFAVLTAVSLSCIVSTNAYGQTFVTKWGEKGTGDGQFNSPRALAIDSSGQVYVADTDNNRIQIFTTDGEFIAKWDSQGHDNGEFYRVIAVAVDGSDNVYVLDENGYRIQKFMPDGDFVTGWKHEAVEYVESELYGAVALATDSKSNVYVIDWGNQTSKVKKFTTDGEYVTSWPAGEDKEDNPYTAYGLGIDSDDNIYVVGFDQLGTGDAGKVVRKFTSDGEFVTQWGNRGIGDGSFVSPFAMGVDPSGNVYVSDNSMSEIQRFTSQGEFVTKWGSRGSEDGQFQNALGIAADANGNVYVSEDLGNRVQKFTSGEAPPADNESDDFQTFPQSVEVDGETIELSIQSSSTINGLTLDEASKKVALQVDAQSDGTVIIPIGRILEGPYVVTIDGQETDDFEVNGQNEMTLEYPSSAQEITITGTNVVPEFPAIVLGVIAAVVGVVAVAGRIRTRPF